MLHHDVHFIYKIYTMSFFALAQKMSRLIKNLHYKDNLHSYIIFYIATLTGVWDSAGSFVQALLSTSLTFF